MVSGKVCGGFHELKVSKLMLFAIAFEGFSSYSRLEAMERLKVFMYLGIPLDLLNTKIDQKHGVWQGVWWFSRAQS